MINICYHGIGEPPRELEAGEDHYWISVDQYLRSLDEIATWPDAAISFDDGNASDAAIGLPALVERDLTASFFVVAGRVDHDGSLDRDAIRELCTSGMTVGTHGMHHRPWTELDADELSAELVDARAEIAETTGRPVTEAALPLGRYDRGVLKELRRLGYERVYTSDRAPARADAWLQPRYSVTRDDTVASLRDNILGQQGILHQLRGFVNATRKRAR